MWEALGLERSKSVGWQRKSERREISRAGGILSGINAKNVHCHRLPAFAPFVRGVSPWLLRALRLHYVGVEGFEAESMIQV